MQFFGYRNRPAADAVDPDPGLLTEADIKSAYDRGRKDERARRRRSPLVTMAFAAVALVGVGVIALAAMEGSFTRGGQVVDANLAVAADQAAVTSRDAAEAAQDAGQSLRDSADRAN